MTLSNQLDPEILQILLHYERQALVGRLLPGMVHNLSGAVQMARLSLDLLELQMEAGEELEPQSALDGMKNGMTKLFRELELLTAKSTQCGDQEPRSHDLKILVNSQLDYWGADLFFKHEVELETRFEPGLPKVKGPYCDIAMVVNLMVEICIDGMRRGQERIMRVGLWPDLDQVKCTIQGGAWTGGWEPELRKASGEIDYLGLRLYLARKTAQKLGGELGPGEPPQGGILLSLPQAD